MKVLKKGFTLIELIIIIAIIAILIVIAVPSFSGYVEKAKEKVCQINCAELLNMYNAYLINEGLTHEEKLFENFMARYSENLCPKNGVISYEDGRIKCDIHFEKDRGNDEDDHTGGDVPYI